MAAGRTLHRSHPSVFAAVARLEAQLDLALFDRKGYRTVLTEIGRALHERVSETLGNLSNLALFSEQLRRGEETVLRVVLGDLCPRAEILDLLSRFFAAHPRTCLHLDYEAVGGPAERLREATADIAFHRFDNADVGMEMLPIGQVDLVPVAARGFFPSNEFEEITPDQLKSFTQCVIRDTSQHSNENFFLVEGANRCTVPDHAMKKELVLHGLGWGHLPDFMVKDELGDGRLISLRNRHLPGRVETLAAMRRRDRPHGPVAQKLWSMLACAEWPA